MKIILICLMVILVVAVIHFFSLKDKYPNNSGLRGYIRYIIYEAKIRLKHRGKDPRSEYERLVERCRLLEANKNIFDSSYIP